VFQLQVLRGSDLAQAQRRSNPSHIFAARGEIFWIAKSVIVEKTAQLVAYVSVSDINRLSQREWKRPWLLFWNLFQNIGSSDWMMPIRPSRWSSGGWCSGPYRVRDERDGRHISWFARGHGISARYRSRFATHLIGYLGEINEKELKSSTHNTPSRRFDWEDGLERISMINCADAMAGWWLKWFCWTA